MDTARIRYRNLPDWVKQLLQALVDEHNATTDPKDENYLVIHPRDVINTSLTFGSIPELRRHAIQDIFAHLSADGLTSKAIYELVSTWFDCGLSLITNARHPAQAAKRIAKRTAMAQAARAQALEPA